MSATATDLRAQLPYVPRALRLVWSAAPWWSLAWLLLLLIQGLLPAGLVYLTRILVDQLAALAGTGTSWQGLRGVLFPAALMAVLLLLTELLRAGGRLVRTAQADLVRDHVSGLIHHRAVAVDIAQFESPTYHDRLYRARIDAHERPVALVQNLGSLLQNAITLAAMTVVLIPYGWWVPLALAISTIPALVVVARYAVRHHRWTVGVTPDSRRTWYYDWLLCTRETAPEVRLFDLGPHFTSAFQRIRGRLRSERLALSKSEGLAEMAAASFALVITGVLVVWMVAQTIAGTATLGGLAMFVQAFVQGQKLMRSLLETVGQIWANSLFLENLFGFLAVKPEIVDPQHPRQPPSDLPPSLRLRGVHFAFPSATSTVFDGLDIEFEARATTALLGVNGAGKSTLFKLLSRFYDPQQGVVEIGGIDIREFSVTEVRRMITILFQEPVHYSETVHTNISLGANLDGHSAAIDRAITAAGAQNIISRLPDGLQTALGTWFEGGAELSVGEWQRIALARSLFRETPVLLLDEPTAAMDSWAEAEWVENLKKLAIDKTVVIITHRLTTAMHADRIHIMDRGRIVESGTHRELISAAGPYQKAWDGQFGRAWKKE
jgi:ATP-binding cassette subfamily B protein